MSFFNIDGSKKFFREDNLGHALNTPCKFVPPRCSHLRGDSSHTTRFTVYIPPKARCARLWIKLWPFQSSEVGLFAGLHATQHLISNKKGGISKMKVAFICHNIKEVRQLHLHDIKWNPPRISLPRSALYYRGSSTRWSAAASSRRPPRPANWRKPRPLPGRGRSSSDKS